MKKIVALLSIAAIAITMTASPALAKEENGNKGEKNDDRGLHLGKILREFRDEANDRRKDHDHDDDLAASQFLLTGTVGSTTSGSIVINVKASIHVPTLTANLATVNVDANTKYTAEKLAVTLADVKPGMQVMVTGTVSGTTLTAQKVHIMFPKGKAYGEVTAKTDTSITVKNTVTGTTQTFTTDADTKVNINGEAKVATDINIGDKGVVKFKTRLAGLFAKVINLFR